MGRRKKSKPIIEAAATGDRLEALTSMRDLLAQRLQTSNSNRDIAALSRRLMQCVTEIEEIQKARAAAPENTIAMFRERLKLSEKNRKTTLTTDIRKKA